MDDSSASVAGFELSAFPLPRDPTSPARAREIVRTTIGPELEDQALERALLTASELTTNALKHGEGRIELRLGRHDGRVRIEVIDEGSGAVGAIRRQASSQGGGWGLRIVDELATRWGCFEGTTHVWAELGLED